MDLWKDVKLLVLDFDGVLTSNDVWTFGDGSEGVVDQTANAIIRLNYEAQGAQAVLERLLGEQAFTGISPVDVSCGLPDAMY